MACFHPLVRYANPNGGCIVRPRDERPSALVNGWRSNEIPCGQCTGCRLERSRQWAMRCMHEAQMHEVNVFITLTYDDANLRSLSLVYRDFQLFMKRLRKHHSVFDVKLWQWVPRFYMAGEYGDNFGRPHFHACLFGVFFEDRVKYRRLPSGFDIYTSTTLSDLWPFGFSSIGDVSFESAAYVARYLMKKRTGINADKHYECVDGETGEIIQREPEFNHMSLKPGIGGHWFRQFRGDVFEHDYVVVRGNKMKPPKYYDRLLKEADAFESEYVGYMRGVKAEAVAIDNTAERLAVREICANARLAFKIRSI